MAKAKAAKSSVSLSERGKLSGAEGLTAGQASRLSKKTISQEGKTARQKQSGMTKRTTARSAAITASATQAVQADADARKEEAKYKSEAESAKANATRAKWEAKAKEYDALAMGGIGATDEESSSSTKGPGSTTVWQ